MPNFPTSALSSCGVAVAGLLTALVRRVLPTAPAFSIDAPVQAPEKHLLATCIALLCGGEPSCHWRGQRRREFSKRLLSMTRWKNGGNDSR